MFKLSYYRMYPIVDDIVQGYDNYSFSNSSLPLF